MAKLHEQLAESLLEILEPVKIPVAWDEEGNVTAEELRRPSPAELAVIAKFLKDNSITSEPAQGGAIEELEQKIKARRGRALTPADHRDALARIGQDLIQ